MPMKLNVGLSKKVGLPNYGSMGASCHVELELDGALLQSDLDRFHQHVQRAFVACRQAVQDELTRQGCGAQHDVVQDPNSSDREPGMQGGSDRPSGNRGARPSKRVTSKQVRYCTEMADRIEGLGAARLAPLIQRMYGKALADLSTLEASNLIATLRDMKDGKITLQAVFGAAA